MKNIFTIAIVLIASFYFVNSFVGQSPPIAGNWQLTFSEDFNGTHLNPKKWRVGQHWLGANGIGGNSAKQITVRNGNVEIKAERKPFLFVGQNRNYATSEITTFQHFRQKYGYFEARIKYDAVKGAWPAFWTMPDRGCYGEESKTFESYLKFDISSLLQPVSSALLKIKVIEIIEPIDSFDVSVHKLLSHKWSEKNITWNTKPEYDPAWLALCTGSDDTSNINEIIEGEYLIVDVTDYVNKQISKHQNVGFAVIDIFMKNRSIKFGSKEAKLESERPHLVFDNKLIFPTDDAYVRGGSSYADKNFGNASYLKIFDPGKGETAHIGKGGMEFDIMESLGIWGNDKTQHALHWGFYGDNHPHTGSSTQTLTPTGDGFHIYAMNWQPGKVDFYIDHKLSWSYKNPRVGSVESFVLLSLQLGGWDGNGEIDDANLPAIMYVDYVRIYEDKL